MAKASRFDAIRSRLGAAVSRDEGPSLSLEEIVHKHASHHRDELLASEVCGCFNCVEMFPPGEITDWTDDDTTAICPRCGIDAVFGDASGYQPTTELLDALNQRWFS